MPNRLIGIAIYARDHGLSVEQAARQRIYGYLRNMPDGNFSAEDLAVRLELSVQLVKEQGKELIAANLVTSFIRGKVRYIQYRDPWSFKMSQPGQIYGAIS